MVEEGCPGSPQGGPTRARRAPHLAGGGRAWGVPVDPPGQPGQTDGLNQDREGPGGGWLAPVLETPAFVAGLDDIAVVGHTAEQKIRLTWGIPTEG